MLYLPNGEFDAKASTTEEPDAGKLHVRVCAGVSGNGRSYREMRRKNEVDKSDASYSKGASQISLP